MILLDVMMPGKDGHAFRAAQRADATLAAIPVIVFSGAYDVGSIAEQLGVRDYLTKPFDVQRFARFVRRRCGPTPPEPVSASGDAYVKMRGNLGRATTRRRRNIALLTFPSPDRPDAPDGPVGSADRDEARCELGIEEPLRLSLSSTP
ncbi:MAG: response regulator [Candidatus Binatia bacterium]